MNNCENINNSFNLSSNFSTIDLNEMVKGSPLLNMASSEKVSDFENLSLDSLKRMIHLNEKKEFRNFFNHLNLQNKQEEASLLIKQLLKEANKDFVAENKDYYLFIKKNVKKIYPQINPFFTNPKINSDTSIISPKGIEVIMKELKDKGSLKDMKSIICSNFNELEIQMLQTIEKMENQNLFYRCCFLVRCFGKYKKSRHVAPIYLEKLQKSNYITFLTDSVGEDGISYVISSIIKDILNKANIKTTKYIYTGKTRQKDQTNCSIFSICDGLYFAKHSEELKEWAIKYGQKGEEEEDEILLNKLPLKMMKTTQFLSLMQKREEEESNSIGLKFKHLINSSKGKIYNAKTISTYLKYERLIIAKAIKNIN